MFLLADSSKLAEPLNTVFPVTGLLQNKNQLTLCQWNALMWSCSCRKCSVCISINLTLHATDSERFFPCRSRCPVVSLAYYSVEIFVTVATLQIGLCWTVAHATISVYTWNETSLIDLHQQWSNEDTNYHDPTLLLEVITVSVLSLLFTPWRHLCI